MTKLGDEILRFLDESGLECRRGNRKDPGDGLSGGCGIDILLCTHALNHEQMRIISVEVIASSPAGAMRQREFLEEAVNRLSQKDGAYPLIVFEDRWRRNSPLIRQRLLAHLGMFGSIFARNCQVRRIDKPLAASFLEHAHSYGDASCKYRYGLFLIRHTGHCRLEGAAESIAPGTLIAVAEFSGARRWKKENMTISSYEWTRYASLPWLRISGGMGKILRHFIEQVQPDDIMSYADLEWSEGLVYEQLGFIQEDRRKPVLFKVDPKGWQRKVCTDEQKDDSLYIMNLGSRKYRLKLKDYR